MLMVITGLVSVISFTRFRRSSTFTLREFSSAGTVSSLRVSTTLYPLFSNNDYYILKKTPTPIIIVECGFLSNETEAALLVTDAYQEKLVRAVYLGAITYLESGKDVPDTAT